MNSAMQQCEQWNGNSGGMASEKHEYTGALNALYQGCWLRKIGFGSPGSPRRVLGRRRRRRRRVEGRQRECRQPLASANTKDLETEKYSIYRYLSNMSLLSTCRGLRSTHCKRQRVGAKIFSLQQWFFSLQKNNKLKLSMFYCMIG